MLFDQYKQGDTIGLRYSYDKGEHWAALNVWELPNIPSTELREKIEVAERKPEPERSSELKVLQEQARSHSRVFVGKSGDGMAAVILADAKGTPRLIMKVDRGGEAAIQFLDENGKVTTTLPGK